MEHPFGLNEEDTELTAPYPAIPMAVFAASIAAEQSARLVISVPGAHVAPFVVRTWYFDGGGSGDASPILGGENFARLGKGR